MAAFGLQNTICHTDICHTIICHTSKLSNQDQYHLKLQTNMKMGFLLPKFCQGSSMAISKSAATKIYKTAIDYDWKLPLEDVLFSGVLRTIANVPISINENVAQNPWSSVKHLRNQLLIFEFERIFYLQ